MKNKSYTELWVKGFDRSEVKAYADKFRRRWQKNVKHREQVEFIREYLRSDMRWCDCPIGSGRLGAEMRTDMMVGLDRSRSFLAYNRERGVECVCGDLHDIPFGGNFDLVTSLHTIFAFDSYREILAEMVRILAPGGILVVDIPNAGHVENAGGNTGEGSVARMTEEEIRAFFGGLNCDVLQVKPHDFWDNSCLVRWWAAGGRTSVWLKRHLWGLINRLYFTLGLFPVMKRAEGLMPRHLFVKYLVAVRKKQETGPEV